MSDTLHIDDLDGAVTLFKSTDEGTETIAVFDEELESFRCDDYELEINFQNEDMVIVSGEELQAIINDGWVLDSVRSFAEAGMSLLFTRKEMVE